MASAGALFPKKAVVQRAGYLIDFMAQETNTGFDTGPLHKLVKNTRYRALSPSGGPGHRNPRWRITGQRRDRARPVITQAAIA